MFYDNSKECPPKDKSQNTLLMFYDNSKEYALPKTSRPEATQKLPSPARVFSRIIDTLIAMMKFLLITRKSLIICYAYCYDDYLQSWEGEIWTWETMLRNRFITKFVLNYRSNSLVLTM